MRFNDRRRLMGVLQALKECSGVLGQVIADDTKDEYTDLVEVEKAVDVGMMLLYRFYRAETEEKN